MRKRELLSKIKSKGKIKAVEYSEDIYLSYLEKAKNCLGSAKLLFSRGFYENSISEAYYAMYNSALALFYLCGIKCENHTGAILLFSELFKMPALSQFLESGKKARINAQYLVIPAGKDSEAAAKEMLLSAENFMLEMRAYSMKTKKSEIEILRKEFLDF
ncbi:MAG: HEPN domain-containing protein [Candidatus Woesearchaeota archaeon]|nr:HEPN domain-containing protein [Candidatus Woesearchaeota archaeon]